MKSQEMWSQVRGRQAFARQIRRFVRELVVRYLGRTAPALAVSRARRTRGMARPVAMSGLPRESQDAEMRL